MSDRRPYTRDELNALLPRLSTELLAVELAYPNARPLPPMLRQEALDYIGRVLTEARSKPLTAANHFLVGQLLSIFEQAIRAEMLGLHGRWYCIPEATIQRMVEENRS